MNQRQRLYLLGGMALAAAAIVAVVIAVTSGGGSSGKKGIQPATKASGTVTSVASLLRGIPQSGTTLGNPKAPVSVTYFGDLQCPNCKDFTLAAFKDVIAKQVRTGKVQVTYRALETATQDPTTFVTQQVAALAAGKQNLMWQYVELFYHQQGEEGSGYVTEAYLDKLARQVPGLNYAKWKADRGSAALQQQVAADEGAAQQAKINSTPGLLVQGSKGTQQVSGAVPYSNVADAIAKVA